MNELLLMKNSINKKIDKIHELIEEIMEEKKEDFIPGETAITTGLAVYDHEEINSIIDSNGRVRKER